MYPGVAESRIRPALQVTVGMEGFFGPGNADDPDNPQAEQGATWPQQTGQDFSAQDALPDIDFSAIHIWPDGTQLSS